MNCNGFADTRISAADQCHLAFQLARRAVFARLGFRLGPHCMFDAGLPLLALWWTCLIAGRSHH